jgi:hypothetical protein
MITMIAAASQNNLKKNTTWFARCQTILKDLKSNLRTSHHYGKENI